MCALSLMNCNSDHSVAAAAAMMVCACQNQINFVLNSSFFFKFYYQLNYEHSLTDGWLQFKGIAKEAKARIEWMIKMKELLDDFNLPDDQLMEKTFFAPGGHVDDIASSEAAKTTRY